MPVATSELTSLRGRRVQDYQPIEETEDVLDEVEQENLIQELSNSINISEQVINLVLAFIGVGLLIIMFIWSFNDVSMKLHLILNGILIICAFLTGQRPNSLIPLRIIIALVITMIVLNFATLILPSWVWHRGSMKLILALDLACMLETAGILYSRRSAVEIRKDLDRLKSLKYNIFTA